EDQLAERALLLPEVVVVDRGPSGGRPEHDIAAALTTVLSGLVDFRLIDTGTAQDWRTGGPGLTRYGALPDGTPGTNLKKATVFRLPQASLIFEALWKSNVTAHVQANFDDHADTNENRGHLGVVEAYAIPFHGEAISLRAGVLIPPLSLEHPGPAWSTLYTITPSAVNTWIGEELRPLAAEFTWNFSAGNESALSVTAALFSNNDPAGAILSWRGWALHDWQFKAGDRLRMQTDIVAALSSTGWTSPFKEVDGRMGGYAKVSYRKGDKFKIEAAYWDNGGDRRSKDLIAFANDYAWKTAFTHVAVQYKPSADLTFLAQGLAGSTEMGDPVGAWVQNDFTAWYALGSYLYRAHRLTFRYDLFQVIDRDGFAADLNDQKGFAQTAAYTYNIDDRKTVSAEYLHPFSERPGNSNLSRTDPYDDTFQLQFRMIF
ncbi:MAG: hypothetical protein ABL958_07015, partial [Bdellovibrionia bacterium]